MKIVPISIIVQQFVGHGAVTKWRNRSKGDPDHVFCWMPLDRLVPVDESLRADFHTKPDPSQLQMLSAENYHENPVLRMIVAKCAALRKANSPNLLAAFVLPTSIPCSNGCGKPAKSACVQCKQVKYCGKKCQSEHWEKGGHNKVCKTQKLSAAETAALERLTTAEFNHAEFLESMAETRFAVSILRRRFAFKCI